jgi:hypothetical protein
MLLVSCAVNLNIWANINKKSQFNLSRSGDEVGPLSTDLPSGLRAEVLQELGLVAAEEEAFFEEEQVGDDEFVDELPAVLPELVDDLGHVLDGDAVAHQGQEPPIDETFRNDVQLLHEGVEVGYLLFEDKHYVYYVLFQQTEMVQIQHPQLLVFHGLNQRPEGLLRVLYVVEQHARDHVEALHIPQVDVIDAVGYQDLFEHAVVVDIAREGRAFGVGPQQILLNLYVVLLFGSLA